MKTRLPVIIAAALLTPGCEKQEESKPSRVVQPAAVEKKTPPAPVPEPPAPAADQTTAPAPGDLQSFFTDLDKLGKQVAQIQEGTAQPGDIEAMQKSYTELIQRRSALMAGMTAEQKKKLMQDQPPSARNISQTLIRLRLAKAREKIKSGGPAQADPALGDLIPQGNTPPAPPQ